jgi:hypothetical protein
VFTQYILPEKEGDNGDWAKTVGFVPSPDW